MHMTRWNQLFVAAGAAITASSLGGCGTVPRPAPPAESLKPSTAVPAPQQEAHVKRLLYLPTVIDTELRLRPVAREFPESMSGGKEVMQALMNAHLDGTRIFPKGTRVLAFTVDNAGVATVDLSSAIRTYSGGSDQEAGAVNAIVLTAAQFPGVKLVKITCEGQEMESLGGHSDLTIPQEPDTSMVARSARERG